jgi:hypothetical protein
MPVKDYLTRPEAAQYLTERGLKTSKNTLQKKATTGGGPEYQLWGNMAVYRPPKLDSYIEQKLSTPRRSTSETPGRECSLATASAPPHGEAAGPWRRQS